MRRWATIYKRTFINTIYCNRSKYAPALGLQRRFAYLIHFMLFLFRALATRLKAVNK